MTRKDGTEAYFRPSLSIRNPAGRKRDMSTALEMLTMLPISATLRFSSFAA